MIDVPSWDSPIGLGGVLNGNRLQAKGQVKLWTWKEAITYAAVSTNLESHG
jgi:hypothetical protein